MASRPIDEKIVTMKLDNSDFKRKAVETTSLFGKLRESLNKIPGANLGKVTNDLNGIQKAAGNTNLSNISKSVDAVASRFTNLGIVATTALVNISNRAVNAGLNLANSLTLAPLKQGFDEYELKMGSIQTILANTQRHGTTLDDVTASLSDLNEYADKTIYNFGDMTRNIGLFTNAGLKLEESTSMIKGFSNAAAASGTNAEKAAGAAYQLSQGLSSGYLMQMDWMSLTNAGMGNDNMKRDLIALGQAMGTLEDHYTSTEVLEDWKNLLSDEKWLTSGVMSTYLQAMAGDLDKATLMAQGLTEAQADLLLQNAKTGEESATYVRTFTQMLGTLREVIGSGWAVSSELIFGDFDQATKLWTSVSESLGAGVDSASDSINRFLRGVAHGGGIKNIFQGIASSVVPVVQIFKALTTGFKKVFPPTTMAQAIRMSESFKEFAKGLTLSKERMGQLTTIFQGVFSVFSTVWEITKRLTKAFVQLIPEGTGDGLIDLLVNFAELAIEFNKSVKEGNAVTKVIEGLGTVLGGIGRTVKDTIGSVYDFSSSLKDNLGTAIDWIKVKLAPVGKYLKDTFGGGFGGDELLGSGMLVGLAIVIGKVLGFFNNFAGIADSVADVFEGVGDAVQNFAMGIKTANLLLIAIAIGILAASLKTLEGLSVADITKGITALGTSLGVMIAGMMVMDKYSVTGGLKAALTLIALAAAVSIMASALKKISDINPKELAVGIGGIVAVTGALALAMIAISKWGGTIGTGSLQLVALAGAVYILASAVKTMADIDSKDLWKSIGALGVIFAQLAIFLKVVDKTKFNISSAIGLLAVAGAIHVMVSAIQKIENIDIDTLVKGLTSIAIILGQIIIFAKLASGKTLLSAGVGLLLISAAINALVGPITSLGNMSWGELIKGLGGMALALAAVVVAANMMNGGLAGAIGIVIMAGALNMLMGPIKMFSSMSWGDMIKGFIGLSGGLAVVAGTAMLLTPAIPSMLGFGAALLIMGVAMLAAGAGVALFGAGLATLATMTLASIAAIVASLSLLLQGLAELIPAAVDFVVKLGLALVDGIVELVPAVVDAIMTLIVRLVDSITTAAPLIVDSFYVMSIAILKVLNDRLPDFIEQGTLFILNLLDGLGRAIPALMNAVGTYMIRIVEGMTETVKTNGPALTDAFLELMGEVVIVMIDAGVKTINALFGWIPGVREAMTVIGVTAEATVRENFGAGDAAKDKGDEFSTGLTSKGGNVRTAAVGLAEVGKSGLNSVDTAPAGVNFGLGFSSGMTSGSAMNSVKAAASTLASAAYTKMKDWLQIKSPSRKTTLIGEDTGQGMANGIASKKKETENASKLLASASTNVLGSKSSKHKESTKGGRKSGTNFAKGVSSTKKTAAQAAKEVADAASNAYREAVATADYKLDMDWITDSQYLSQIKKIAKQYSKYPEIVRETNVKIKRLEEEAVQDKKDANRQKYENEKKSINDRKYFNTISLADEFKFWKTIQSKYKAGTEERMEADREVYRLKNEMIASQFAKDKKLIDDRKYYNDLSLSEELKAWQLIQTKYRSGTDERIEADREVYRLKNEINSKLIAINEEYTSKIKKANEDLVEGERQLKEEYLRNVQDTNQKLIDEERRLTDAYDSALKDRTKSLSNFVGLFDQVQNKKVSGRALVQNLEGQLSTFSSWSENIKALSKKGIDEGLLAELKEMGPQAASEVAALNTLTGEQLTQYSGMWKTKNQLARTEAVSQLEGLRMETYSKIEQLRHETRNQLDKYKTDWLIKVEELRTQTATQLETYKTEWLEKITEISTGTKDEFVKLETSMTEIGSDAIKGMMAGMGKMEGPLMAQAKSIADSISKTIKSALKIKSPSRVTMEDGKFVGEGLAIGLANSVGSVKNSAKKIAITAKDALNQFLNGFETDMDNELHFKAIIDYDKFDASKFGRPRVSIPDTNFTNGLVMSAKSGLRQNDNNYRRDNSEQKEVVGNSTVVHQNLNFHSRQLTPSEVARKTIQASRDLAIQ